MNICDLTFNEPTHQHVGAVPDSTGQRENLAATGVCPPAAVDWAACDCDRERWYGPGSRLQYNPVCAHKFYGVRCCHKRATMQRRLTMSLSDARLRERKTKLFYPNHRSPPWLTEDTTPRSLEPIFRRSRWFKAIARHYRRPPALQLQETLTRHR